jgi:hypothetical protein
MFQYVFLPRTVLVIIAACCKFLAPINSSQSCKLEMQLNPSGRTVWRQLDVGRGKIKHGGFVRGSVGMQSCDGQFFAQLFFQLKSYVYTARLLRSLVT